MVIALGVIASHVWPEEPRAPVETGYPAFGVAGGLRHWAKTVAWKPVLDRFWLIVLAGMIIGMLYPLNTWDYPTYLVITAGSFFLLDALGSAVAANRGRDFDWVLTFSRSGARGEAVAWSERCCFSLSRTMGPDCGSILTSNLPSNMVIPGSFLRLQLLILIGETMRGRSAVRSRCRSVRAPAPGAYRGGP